MTSSLAIQAKAAGSGPANRASALYPKAARSATLAPSGSAGLSAPRGASINTATSLPRVKRKYLRDEASPGKLSTLASPQPEAAMKDLI